MNSRIWRKVKSVFGAAAELARAERSKFLANRRDVDTEIRNEVKNLLENEDQAGDFLQEPLADLDETQPLHEAEVQFRAGDLICERYRVVRYIARGGMGEVYEARDLELNVNLAVKALRPGLLPGDSSLTRFKREVELARSVLNPNVGRIFDFGRHRRDDGSEVAFLTMEYLDGETLAQRIAKAGPLPESEAMPLVRDMTAALGAIHARRIVHRDFKSANVMLVMEDGLLRARVMDFGLARPTVSDATMTESGQVGGTPSYMPPEQFEGVATAATDVYALGVVLHEMITGVRPSRKSKSVVNAPDTWDRVIRKCLATDPVDRFQSAADVLAELERREIEEPPVARRSPRMLIAGISVAILIAAAVLTFWFTHRQSVSAAQKHVALLPIHCDTKDDGQVALCAGLSDTLRGDLTGLKDANNHYWVIPSSESRTVHTASQALREIGANLVIEADLHRLSNEYMLAVELVDPKDNRVIRSTTIKGDNINSLHENALPRLAQLLDLQVPQATARQVAAAGSEEPGAFEFYEQGRGYLLREGSQDLQRSIDLFTKSLLKDPKFTLAYAGLGEAYANKYRATKEREWIDKASQAGAKGVELNASLPQVHAALGNVYRLTGQLPSAIREFRAALFLEPACFMCSFRLGEIYVETGDLDQAEIAFRSIVGGQREIYFGYGGLGLVNEKRGNLERSLEYYRKASELVPDSAIALANLGGVLQEMGRYEEAIPVIRRGLAIREDAQSYTNLGAALMYVKRYDEAAKAMESAVRLVPGNHDYWRNLADSYRQVPALRPKAAETYRIALAKVEAQLAVKPNDADLLSSMGLYYAHLGNKRPALTFIAKARAIAPNDAGVLFTSALSYELAGDRKKALKYLESAAKSGFPLTLIDAEPEFAELREGTGYPKLIETLQIRRRGQQ